MALDIFSILNAEFGSECVAHAPDAMREEPRGRYFAPDMPLIRPRSTDEVSKIIRFCSAHGIAVVPYAGGTGLVSGQVKPDGGAVMLSVDRMTKIRSIHPLENVIIAEAGAVLADVQSAAREHDRLYPLSLAAEGSCRIGGNLATNAGGVNVLRYGNARDLCLGIEAVLPDGSIHHGLKRLRKDNTGYDLRHLMIGSEGSLGVITAASLKLFAMPKERLTAFLAVASIDAALVVLARLQEHLGGVVSGFELIHKTGFEFLSETMPEVRVPFDQAPEWSVLLELGAGAESQLPERLEAALTGPIEAGLVLDALVAQSQAQSDAFWTVRESLPLANRKIGSVSSHDISLPLSAIPEFVAKTPAMLAKLAPFRINCFGHLGDGNLHYNVFPPQGKTRADFEDLRSAVKETIHDHVHALDGSVSAEHGIGRLKTDDLAKYGDPAKLAAIRAIKAALDPKGIMNPGVIIP